MVLVRRGVHGQDAFSIITAPMERLLGMGCNPAQWPMIDCRACEYANHIPLTQDMTEEQIVMCDGVLGGGSRPRG
jgi:hypothetical protein